MFRRLPTVPTEVGVTRPNGTALALTLVAGDTWTWSIALDDYSAADGYTPKFFFRGRGGEGGWPTQAFFWLEWGCLLCKLTVCLGD